MKTKLLVLSCVALVALFVVVFLDKLTVGPAWSQDFRGIQSPTGNIPDDVSVLLPEMQGIQTEEAAYLEDKAIYVSKPNDINEKTSRRKVVDGVEIIFDQKGDKVLFGKGNINERLDLWIANTMSGFVEKLESDVSRAGFSPPSDQIVVYIAMGEVHILAGDGRFLKRVGSNSAMPLFSNDGVYVAYQKLADSSIDGNFQSLVENAQGIAIHNIETGEERILTKDNMDYEPVAFSPDGRSLYFNSGRGQGLLDDYHKGEPFQTPLWVVDIFNGNVRQLNNRGVDGSIVFVHAGAILSSDNSIMISESGNNITMLVFDENMDISSAKILANGTNPRWFVKDEIIAYRAQGAKGKYWEFVSVK